MYESASVAGYCSLKAYLTPAVSGQAQGSVHSVFAQAANVMLDLSEGQRMVTLIDPLYLRVPDSVQMPAEWIVQLQTGMPVSLYEDRLVLAGSVYPLVRCPVDGFMLKDRGRMPRAGAFFSLTEEMDNGFGRIPKPRREHAREALCTENAVKYLGLGPGLTPSFDDACVGVLAVCCAAGLPAPFRLDDLSGTTSVSARYLRLASEGFFGEAVIRVTDALYGEGSLAESVSALMRVGATSGRDILFGMRCALCRLKCKLPG